MTWLRDVLEVSGVVVLIYFALFNLIYLGLTAVAWRGIARHRHSRAYAGVEEMLASPLTPGVSVLLPAYNEQAGVVESVRSLLALRYPRLEVIVVNDGSKDATLERLREAFDLRPVRVALRDEIPHAEVLGTYVSARHPNLVVVDKVNAGKADALNCGISAARHPYFCAVDADAILEEEALLRVIEPIVDDPDRVVATGGIVRIANGCRVEDGKVVEVRLPRSRLATLQVVEYLRAFLVGRMSWNRLDSLLIISGAFGVFRRSVVEAAGGYWTRTVGEDMELVVRIHHHLRDRGEDYRVAFVPDPVCWTEVPEDLRTLGRQRRRWQRGLAESLWRHRRMIGRPRRYGSIGGAATPYYVVFEALGPMIEAFGYVLFPVAVIFGLLSPTFLIAFLILAVALGMLLSFSALMLEEFNFRRHREGRDVARMLAFSLFENVGYRQLVSFWRALAAVDLARRERGWGEQRRRGVAAGRRPEPAQGD
jgi:cellulose synthase/poly-beta-1,6-N-acetylglucosamine synthase-like glycosyltransferase